MNATAIAPANIAFIKYWGNRDEALRIPNHNTLSMCLDGLNTTTTVEFLSNLSADTLEVSGKVASDKEVQRMLPVLNWVRAEAGISEYAQVVSANNFPSGTGIASSASGFAALALASSAAAGLDLPEPQLSALARLGSGSASRSIPSGFVEWQAGTDHNSSFAVSLYPADYWNIRDVIVVVDEAKKKVGSTEGHAVAWTSELYKARLAGMERKLDAVKTALQKRDFTSFGEEVETESLSMHAIMLTSHPTLVYWNGAGLEIMKAVMQWREDGVEGFTTFDAGPNPHILCQADSVEEITKRLEQMPGVVKVFVAKPGRGARITDQS